jgi:hypothetical protein
MTQPTPELDDALRAVILAFLAPILMTGDLAEARTAAQQAISAHKATGGDQLISIAQIVGFALTALDNLRLSMPEDLSMSMKLRLRGNANGLNRSAHRATATLDSQRRAAAPAPTPRPDEAPFVPTSTPEPQPDEAPNVLTALHDARTELRRAQTPDLPADRQIDLSWADAMTDVAAEITADLANLSPAQRRTQLRRIGALADTARALSRGDVPLKSRLLGTTSLRG